MATLTRGWMQVWFPAVPLERVAIFRIAVTLFALVDVALVSNYMIGYTDVDPMFFDPVYLLSVGEDPVPTSTVYAAMTGLLVVSLALAAAGIWTRAALAVAAPLYLYHWTLFNSWGKVNHGKIPVVFALFVLIVAPSAARLSLDAWRRRKAGLADGPDLDPLAGWALRFIGVVIVASYAFSVYSKLRNTGPSWVVEPILLPFMRMGDTWVHQLLGENPELLIVLQGVTFVAEAAAVLVFLGGGVRNVLLATLAGFHLGSYLLLETEFFGFLVCYLVFFDLERMLPRLRRLRAGRPGAPPEAGPGHGAAEPVRAVERGSS